MAQTRYDPHRPFIFWFLTDIIEMYEKSNTIVHVRSIDFNDPMESVIEIERKELGDA